MTDNEILTAINDLKIQVGTYRAEVTAQNTVTNAKLISIDEKLCKQNGRVGKLEERMTPLENHVANTEKLPDKIRQLEDEALSNRSVKKFMLLMFTSGVGLGGLVVAVIKLAIGS